MGRRRDVDGGSRSTMGGEGTDGYTPWSKEKGCERERVLRLGTIARTSYDRGLRVCRDPNLKDDEVACSDRRKLRTVDYGRDDDTLEFVLLSSVCTKETWNGSLEEVGSRRPEYVGLGAAPGDGGGKCSPSPDLGGGPSDGGPGLRIWS